jgi:translation initiation factor 5B
VGISSDVKDLEKRNVKVIVSDVIYSLLDEFEKWQDGERKKQQQQELSGLIAPCKIKLLKGYVFRQSNPAIVGVEVLSGVLKVDAPLMKSGRQITSVRSIQLEKENITAANAGKQVAVSLDKVMIGRQISEGDILYSAIPEEDFRKLKHLKKFLSQEEIIVMKEIAEIMRRENPVWGI